MKILFNQVGKKYNRQWVFRDFNFTFEPGGKYAITGSNGSGKSTLLQCILGSLLQSKGEISYIIDNKKIPAEQAYQHFSFAAPYLELIEEMTLSEMLTFHEQFKPFYSGITKKEILEMMQLEKAENKRIQHFSSGMKQRLKLALAFFTVSRVLLLDEPTSNLDEAGIKVYQLLAAQYLYNRTVIISSNDNREYSFCTNILSIENFK